MWTEGEYFAVPPLVQHHLTMMPSRCLITPLAVSGDPVLPYLRENVSGRPLREVFRRLFPLPCTNRQLSGGKDDAYFFPSTCLLNYPNKNYAICQAFIGFCRSLRYGDICKSASLCPQYSQVQAKQLKQPSARQTKYCQWHIRHIARMGWKTASTVWRFHDYRQECRKWFWDQLLCRNKNVQDPFSSVPKCQCRKKCRRTAGSRTSLK